MGPDTQTCISGKWINSNSNISSSKPVCKGKCPEHCYFAWWYTTALQWIASYACKSEYCFIMFLCLSLMIAITCNASLTAPANGRINMTCNTVGCMVNYYCNRTSVLIGNSTRVCLSNGLWSGSSPVCQGKWKFSFLHPANQMTSKNKQAFKCSHFHMMITYHVSMTLFKVMQLLIVLTS